MGRGIGIPEVLVIAGLLLVFAAGMMERTGGGESSKVKYLAVYTVGELLPFSGYYRHIPLAEKLLLGKGIQGIPLFVQKEKVDVIHGIITVKEHVFEFSIPSELYPKLKRVDLKLYIESSNLYGPLFVFLNGKKIWEGYPKEGLLQIPLPVNLLNPEKNVIRVSCGSSGWRIWAPTHYVISYIEVAEEMDVLPEKTFYFTLYPEELSKIYLFRIYAKKIDVKIPGELAVIFNDGTVVYRGIPTAGSFLVSFSATPLANNSLTFKLIGNGNIEFKDLEVVVLSQANASSASFSFMLSPDSLEKIRQGICRVFLEFPVEEAGDGLLEVYITSTRENTLLREKVREGTVKLEIPPDYLSVRNTITFRSYSRYKIGDAIVKLLCS